MSIVRVDSKGRITLLKEIREKTGIKPRSKLYVKGKEIVIKSIGKNPSDKLTEILGDFMLTRKDRIRAEELMLKEIR